MQLGVSSTGLTEHLGVVRIIDLKPRWHLIFKWAVTYVVEKSLSHRVAIECLFFILIVRFGKGISLVPLIIFFFLHEIVSFVTLIFI